MIITDLCNDVFNIILNFLSVKNLLNASEVSKKFNTFSKKLLLNKIKEEVDEYFDRDNKFSLSLNISEISNTEDQYKYFYNTISLIEKNINNIYDFNNCDKKILREIIKKRNGYITNIPIIRGRHPNNITKELESMNENIKTFENIYFHNTFENIYFHNTFKDEEPVKKDIKIIVDQANVSSSLGTYFYILHKFDIVDAIMGLTMD